MTFPALLIDILSWAMILAGSFFVIIGAVGILRFPDFWSRLHAASVTESAGMILLLIGMALQTGWTLIAFKLGVIGIFMLITGPTSTHAVANAALVSGLRPPKLLQTSPQKAAAEATDKNQTGDA
ncbi:monovalent cation/H(+) antiporter subunit G [Paracoccaceae bacterium]|nr:monovalent cation/H(+) antiporter subunit G [Paracoccaceae bacterium]